MSDFFVWDAARYGLGVAAMDLEHQRLISLMNTLHQLHAQHAPRQQLAPALKALTDYTAQHFADEELYMERINYADRKRHAGVHRQLLERLNEFAAEFQRSGALSERFFMFLKTWLKAHICGIDTRYAAATHVA